MLMKLTPGWDHGGGAAGVRWAVSFFGTLFLAGFLTIFLLHFFEPAFLVRRMKVCCTFLGGGGGVCV